MIISLPVHTAVCCSGRRRTDGASGCPTIRARIVSAARICIGATGSSTPDNHFAAGPYCRVIISPSGRVGDAGGCPAIDGRVVSAAAVQILVADAAVLRPKQSFRCRSTPRCDIRLEGVLVALVAVQLSVAGSYLPPLFKNLQN